MEILKTTKRGNIMGEHDGGPAFPTLQEHGFNSCMTLRDFFAAKALVIVAAAGWIDHIGPYECASAAYEIADSMLAERAK
jgi:hypothetical protein